ncbi:BTB/POZ protein [Whalleya microplaca]|nr:BTB/POZ protein [Whalleya microplaca]
MAPKRNSSSRKRRRDSFLAQDENLLETGYLSDFVVQCESQAWKVHRLILASRCVWFKKALNGRFKESTDGIIEIQNFGPDRVGQILKYIYTGVFPFVSRITPDRFRAPVDLYEVGDYFLLPEIRDHALSRLRKALSQAARILQYRMRLAIPHDATTISESTGDGVDTELCRQFCEIVEYVYGHGILSEVKELREALTGFYLKTELWFVNGQDEAINDLASVPQFAMEIFRARGRAGIDLSGARYPQFCSYCDIDMLSDNTKSPLGKLQLREGLEPDHELMLNACCQSCLD